MATNIFERYRIRATDDGFIIESSQRNNAVRMIFISLVVIVTSLVAGPLWFEVLPTIVSVIISIVFTLVMIIAIISALSKETFEFTPDAIHYRTGIGEDVDLPRMAQQPVRLEVADREERRLAGRIYAYWLRLLTAEGDLTEAYFSFVKRDTALNFIRHLETLLPLDIKALVEVDSAANPEVKRKLKRDLDKIP